MSRRAPSLLALLLVATAASSAPRTATPVSPSARTTPVTTAAAPGGSTSVLALPAPEDHLLIGSSFDRADGTCQPGDWTGEDLTTRTFLHLDPQWLVNSEFAFTQLGSLGPLPARSNEYALGMAGPIVATDTSGIVVLEIPPTDFSRGRWVTTYPGLDRVREFAGSAGIGFGFVDPSSPADFDPVSGGILASDPTRRGLISIGPGGGAPVLFAGGGAVTADTTAALAQIRTDALAVDAAGNVYFEDLDLGLFGASRLRMLRRNDMRVITLANADATHPLGVLGAVIRGGITGIALGDANDLYLLDAATIRRVDLGAATITDVFSDPRLRQGLVYSAGVFYALDLQPHQLLMLKNGVLSLAVGTDAQGGVPYGPASGANLASQCPFPTLGPNAFGIEGDGAGGVYFTAGGGLLLHRHADGTLEPLLGLRRAVRMGTTALRVGLDAGSDAAEVANWALPSGYGNNWSQRAVSPVFDGALHHGATFEFDAALLNGGASPLLNTTDGNAVTVQVQNAGGAWLTLRSRVSLGTIGQNLESYALDTTLTQPDWGACGLFHVVASLGANGNELIALGPETRLRVVVSTAETGSAEDGFGLESPGAAILDNFRLADGPQTLFATDFEDGTLQGWSLAARNQLNLPPANPATQAMPIHDEPAGTLAQLQHHFDFTDTSCVFTFTNDAGVLGPGTLARLTSPWVTLARRDTVATFAFAAKLPNSDQQRTVSLWARVRQNGDATTRGVGRNPVLLTSGVTGDDGVTPLQRVSVRFPNDFLFASSFRNQPAGTPSPASYDPATGADLVQFVLQVEDRSDQPPAGPAQGPSLAAPISKFPYFDELTVSQFGADDDLDGVANLDDACRGASASGQDADGDGCVDPTSTMQHVESWPLGQLPLHYRLSADGDPANLTGEDLGAIRQAFAVWRFVPGADVQVIEDAATTQKSAAAEDGVNLITFEDADFVFPDGVVAITPTLSFDRRVSFHDRIVLPGEIVDADILFNPAFTFATPSHPGQYDLGSVALHETGHFLGLSHSGTRDATMFYVLQSGTEGTSLTADDEAAVASAYPAANFASNYGAITGRVTRGSTGGVIPGALVSAVRLDAALAPTVPVATDYTREDGTYALRHLASGDYAVRITPLDGSEASFGMVPESVSKRLERIAETNFQPEWRSDPESNAEAADLPLAIHVNAAQVVTGADVITNIDVTPPRVVTSSPAADSRDVRIDTSVLLGFSEAVDPASLGQAFKLRDPGGQNIAGGGAASLTNAGRTFVFTPPQPLAFDSDYTLEVTTALTDREHVALAAPFQAVFHTERQPDVAITDVQPRLFTSNSIVTVSGAGFEAAAVSPQFDPRLVLEFGSSVDTAFALQVTPSSMVVRLPDFGTHEGLADARVTQVIFDGGSSTTRETSNPFQVRILNPRPPASAAPYASTALPFAPGDAVLAPDGASAFVVGDADLATVTFAPAPSTAAQVIPRGVSGGRHVVLSPDGLLAYVTRPAYHQVLVFDANPASGTYGSQVGEIATGSDPDGLAFSPSGALLYVTLPDSHAVSVVDTDPTRITHHQVLNTIDLAGSIPAAGISLTPNGRHVVLTSEQACLDLPLSSNGISSSGAIHAGAQASQSASGTNVSGDHWLWAQTGGTIRVAFFDGLQISPRPDISMGGGDVSDFTGVPVRNALLATNVGLNLLQVVSLDSTAGPSFLTKLADVPTESGPVAVSVDGLGSLALVACGGAHSLQRFSLVNAAPIARLVSGAAVPGDLVAASVGLDTQPPGSQVELGGLLLPYAHLDPIGRGGAFVVPATAARGDLPLSLVSPDANAARSLSTTLRVVDAPRDATVRLTDVAAPVRSLPPCIIQPGSRTAGVRVSPDGHMVAVLYYSTEGCLANVDLFDARGDGRADAPGYLATLTGLITDFADVVNEFEFSSDGRRLFASNTFNQVKVYDTDRSSLSFGNLLGAPSLPVVGGPFGLAPEPMGGRVWVADVVSAPIVALPTSPPYTRADTLQSPEPLHALETSPDGQWLAAGGTGRVYLYGLEAHRLLVTGPLHAGLSRMDRLLYTHDGRRLVAFFNGSNDIAVYNLDAASGAFGAELFFGPVPGFGVIADATQGTSPSSLLLCGAADGLTHIELAGNTPVFTLLPLAGGASGLAMSPDRRQLWLLGNSGGGPVLQLAQFGDAGALAAVAGDGQTALPGEEFPLPIRVRVTSATGAPEPGVIVRVEALGEGTFDRRGVALAQHVTDPNGEVVVSWSTRAGVPGPYAARVSLPAYAAVPALTLTSSAVESDADTPPLVLEIGPAPGSTGILPGSELLVRFNQSMQLATVESRLTLLVNGNAVPGAARPELGGRTVFWKPAQPLPPLAACVFTLGSGALDADGQSLAQGATTTFQAADTPRLHLDDASPPAAAVGASVTLNGSGFSPVGPTNAVVLAGHLVPVLSASATSLVVRIPEGASSGDVVVQTGGNASNALGFNVLAPDTSLGGVVGTLPERSGVRAIAITPDGTRAYATNVITNSVAALDLQHAQTITNITVGQQPVAIAILPSGTRAYVANLGSDNLSVLDVNPESPAYHTKLFDLNVGDQPIALAITRDGTKVLVACKGDSTVFVIGSQPGTAAYDHVTKSATVASGSQSIAVSPDGTRAYIGTTVGLSILDLRSGGVTKSATVASGSQSIAVSPDGAFVYILTGGGELVVVDVSPNSTNYNKVVKSATVASGSQSIAVSADGASIYVTDVNGRVLVYTITFSDPGSQVTLVPGAAVTLTLQHEYTVGQGASGIAVDPSGQFVLVVNTTAGTITGIGAPSALGVVAMGFDFKPETLNLRSHGRFVEAVLAPPDPFLVQDIDVASLRIQGVLPVSHAAGAEPRTVVDEQGQPELHVKFDRLALETLLEPGDHVPIRLSGLVAGRVFEGVDTVRVIRGSVRSPREHESLEPGTTHVLAWDSPPGGPIRFVNLVVTFDQGTSWRTLASHLPNSGQWSWLVPDTLADSVRVCVLLAEGNEDAAGDAPGMVATSGLFRILRTTSVERDIPGTLRLSRPAPNPARGGAVVLRFGLPVASDVRLELFDVMGRQVHTFVDGRRAAGWYDVRWDGVVQGGLARPGLYWVRLRQGSGELRQPLIWLR